EAAVGTRAAPARVVPARSLAGAVTDELARLVSRVGGRPAALEQPVAGARLPARGAGQGLAVGEDRVADELLPRVVGRGAGAVAAVHAEVVARDHHDVDPLDFLEDVVDDADAGRALDLDHDQDVVVGVGGIALAPEPAGLAAARAAMAPGPGVRRF